MPEIICTPDCEIACPLMRVGRACPSLAQARAEIRSGSAALSGDPRRDPVVILR